MSDFNRYRGCGAPLFTSAANDCGCSAAPLAISCTCQATTVPGNPGQPEPDEGCGCCKASMREALKLLCSNQISDLLDFDGFAFVTDDLLVGTQPAAMGATAKDNLTTPTGTFRRFSPCNCDLIDISGTAYGPFGALVDVEQATLCSLSAMVFQVTGAGTPETPAPTPAVTVNACCDTPPTTAEGRYLRVRDLLQCRLSAIDGQCGECVCHCNCTDDCCCAQGVLAALSTLSLNKRATLVAGLLALRNVTVLGTIGNVLVLGNEDDYRFYFVCANKVEMLS